jgi:hypothetical protein
MGGGEIQGVGVVAPAGAGASEGAPAPAVGVPTEMRRGRGSHSMGRIDDTCSPNAHRFPRTDRNAQGGEGTGAARAQFVRA